MQHATNGIAVGCALTYRPPQALHEPNSSVAIAKAAIKVKTQLRLVDLCINDANGVNCAYLRPFKDILNDQPMFKVLDSEIRP